MFTNVSGLCLAGLTFPSMGWITISSTIECSECSSMLTGLSLYWLFSIACAVVLSHLLMMTASIERPMFCAWSDGFRYSFTLLTKFEAENPSVSPCLVVRLQTNMSLALDFDIASLIPFGSKFGSMLVKRSPGPRIIALAFSAAFSAVGFACTGFLRKMRLIAGSAASRRSIADSENMMCPSYSSAHRCPFSNDTGMTFPFIRSILDASSIASDRLPVFARSPASSKLPRLCPTSALFLGNRNSSI